MNTRNRFRLLTLVVAFVMTNIVFAQGTYDTKVKEMAKKMFVDMNNKDYESILNMSHPKLFEVASREQIITMFKSMLEGNNDFVIELPGTIPEYKVSKVIEKDSSAFAFVSYDLKMKMTFKNQSFDDEAKKGMQSMMGLRGMEVDFVSDNTLDVLMKDQITILLKDETTKQQWAMVNYDPDSPLMGMFLSSSVLEEAKKYREDMTIARKKEEEKKNE